MEAAGKSARGFVANVLVEPWHRAATLAVAGERPITAWQALRPVSVALGLPLAAWAAAAVGGLLLGTGAGSGKGGHTLLGTAIPSAGQLLLPIVLIMVTSLWMVMQPRATSGRQPPRVVRVADEAGAAASAASGATTAAAPKEMIFRNGRVVDLVSQYEGCSTLWEVWRNAVRKYPQRNALGYRRVVKEVQQVEDTGPGTGKAPGTQPKSITKVVLAPEYRFQTYAEVDKRVLAVGAGLHRLLTTTPLPAVLASGASRISSSSSDPASSAASGTRAAAPADALRHVCIYADTKPEWIVSLMGCAAAACTVVTAYATLGIAALAYALDLTDSRIVITDAALLSHIVDIMGGHSIAERGDSGTASQRPTDASKLQVVVWIPRNAPDGAQAPNPAHVQALQTRPAALGGPIRVLSYSELEALGAAFPLQRPGAAMTEAQPQTQHGNGANGTSSTTTATEAPSIPVAAPKPDDLALINFTSGTTGLPKGVEVLHSNLAAAVAGMAPTVAGLEPSDVVGPAAATHMPDVYLAFLPLAHVLEIAAECCLLSRGACLGYSSPGTITDTARNMAREDVAAGIPKQRGDAVVLQPTIMAGAPLIYNRLKAAVEAKLAKASFLQRAMFNLAYARRKATLSRGEDSPFWRWLVFDRVKAAVLGPRLRGLLSGGGPLAPAVQEWTSVVFAPLMQGFGLTETCAAGTISWPDDCLTGRVGPPCLCCDIKLVNSGSYTVTSHPPAGEVLIGGPIVTRGYYKQPEKTLEGFVRDAAGRVWCATGDIAQVEGGEGGCGFALRIIDRKKDLVKLAHGEYIPLSRVETNLTSPLVEFLMAYAGPQAEHLVALVVPAMPALRAALAAGEGTSSLAQADTQQLLGSSVVKHMLVKELQQVGASRGLSRVEVPRAVVCVHEPAAWQPGGDLLTESFKLKRAVIIKRYRPLLDGLYNEKVEAQ